MSWLPRLGPTGWFAVLAFGLPIPAQSDQDEVSQEELVARRSKKRQSAFLRRAAWEMELDKAKARSSATGKLILAYFTRSYAPSPPCTAVENGLFSTKGFDKVADKVVLFCHISSRVSADAKHQSLLPSLGIRSYPSIAIIDEQARRITRVSAGVTFAELTRVLDGEVAAFMTLREKATKGDKSAKAGLFMKRLALGHLEPAAIQRVLTTADYLSPAQIQQVRRGLAGLEVKEILARIDEKDKASFKRAVEQILVMKRAGRIPSGRMAFAFWQVLLGHASSVETPNADLFAEALENIRKLPGRSGDEEWFGRMKVKLKLLRFMEAQKKKRGR